MNARGVRTCEGCGCTSLFACPGGCGWSGPSARLCTECVKFIDAGEVLAAVVQVAKWRGKFRGPGRVGRTELGDALDFAGDVAERARAALRRRRRALAVVRARRSA